MKFDYFDEMMMPEQWTEADERRVYAESVGQIVAAEAAGFNQVWVAEHQQAGFSHVPNPEILFGAWTQHTSRIRFGFGVQLLPGSHPIAIAARTAMADVVTGGRVDVGTGRNVDNWAQLGLDMSKSREMWEESVHLLPKLWTEPDVVNPDGKFWPWTEPWNTLPKPVQKPHPPLWIAAMSHESVERAGTAGLGCLAAAYTGLEFATGVAEAYKRGAASPADPVGLVRTNQISASSTYICHEPGDDEAAERIKKATLGARVIRYFRGQNLLNRAEGVNRAGLLLPDLTDDEIFTKTGIQVGPPEKLIAYFRELEAAGFDRALVNMQMPGIPNEDIIKSIELFGSSIIPELDEAATPATASA